MLSQTSGARPAERANEAEPLLVRPRGAWRLLGCGNTRGYALLNAGVRPADGIASSNRAARASCDRYACHKLRR